MKVTTTLEKVEERNDFGLELDLRWGETIPTTIPFVTVNFPDKLVIISLLTPQIDLSFTYDPTIPPLKLFVQMNNYLLGEMESFMEQRGWREFGSSFLHSDMVSGFPTRLDVSFIPAQSDGEITVPAIEELLLPVRTWENIIPHILDVDVQLTVQLHATLKLIERFGRSFYVEDLKWSGEMDRWGKGEWAGFVVRTVEMELPNEEYLDEEDEEVIRKILQHPMSLTVEVNKKVGVFVLF